MTAGRARADSIRRRVEREEAKAEDYDAFGDAGIPVVKEQPDGFAYADWANCGAAAAKLEAKEFAAGTVAVWKGSYWDLFAPKGGDDAEPEKTEEEIRAEQEAAREKTALEGLYRSLIGFVASGAFAMSKDLMACVCADRGDPAALLAAMGGDSLVENDERFGAVRDEFARNLKACRPSEYEAGCWLMAAAKDMAQFNNRWGGDDAEAWLDHYGIFCSAGFEPARRTCGSWRGCRRALRRRRMSSEKKVRVTVEACGAVRSFECRCATVSTVSGNGFGDAYFVGPASLGDLFALTCKCIDVLCAAFSQAGVSDRHARKLMLLAALRRRPPRARRQRSDHRPGRAQGDPRHGGGAGRRCRPLASGARSCSVGRMGAGSPAPTWAPTASRAGGSGRTGRGTRSCRASRPRSSATGGRRRSTVIRTGQLQAPVLDARDLYLGPGERPVRQLRGHVPQRG